MYFFFLFTKLWKSLTNFHGRNMANDGHEHGVRRGVFGGKLSFKKMSAEGRLCTSQENPHFWVPTIKVRQPDGTLRNESYGRDLWSMRIICFSCEWSLVCCKSSVWALVRRPVDDRLHRGDLGRDRRVRVPFGGWEGYRGTNEELPQRLLLRRRLRQRRHE